MKGRAAGISDVGRCRQTNQDQFLIDPRIGLYAVADGMGGHAAGEVASRLAVDTLAQTMGGEAGDGNWTADEAAERLKLALAEGNRRICDSVITRSEWRGMGTTVVALVDLGDRAVIGHVGDSRAYLFRNGRLRQLTSDHSWVNEQVKHGLLTDEEAHRSPYRNIVTRALGSHPHVEVEISEEGVSAGDVFVLCSDGLSSMLRDEEILETLARDPGDPQRVCRALVDLANRRGGEDNITVIVVSRVQPD